MKGTAPSPDGTHNNGSSPPRQPLPPGIGIWLEDPKRPMWRVTLSRRFTGGKLVLKRFRRIEDAEAWIAEQVKAKEHHGFTAFMLSPDQLADARAAFQRLEGLGKLEDAVRFYIRHVKPGEKKTIAAAIEELYKSKKTAGKSHAHLQGMRSRLRRFARYMEGKHINEVFPKDIRAFLDQLSVGPVSRGSEIRHLKLLFNFSRKRGYITAENPVQEEIPLVDAGEVSIFKPEEAAKLLSVAGDLTPYFAISLFAGLRPFEAQRLDWSNIDLDAKKLYVRKSKKRDRGNRTIDMMDNLVEWLRPYRQDAGAIIPRPNDSANYFRLRFRALTRSPELAPFCHPWRYDIMRHSFGSYFYARSKNENETAVVMGTSPQMLFRHYRSDVRKEDVEAWWEL